MKSTQKKLTFAALALAILLSGSLISCDRTAQNDADVKALEERLDKIMSDYTELNAEHEKTVSALDQQDSIIKDQEQQIRQLIDNLKQSNGKGTSASGSSRALAKKAKELKKLQKHIEELNSQLEEKSRQIEELQAAAPAAAGQNVEVPASYLEELEMLRSETERLNYAVVALTGENVSLGIENDSLTRKVAVFLNNQNAKENNIAQNNAAYTQQIDELQAVIEQQKVEIERLNDQVSTQVKAVEEAQQNSKKRQGKAVAEIQSRLDALQAECDSYKARIAELEAENAALRSQNDTLTAEVANLRGAVEENNAARAKMEEKFKKVAVFQTEHVQLLCMKRVGNNSATYTRYASSAAAFKIAFDVLPNPAIEAGPVTYYACILDPDGKTISNGTLDQYNFMLDGQPTMYTQSAEREYFGELSHVEFDWIDNVDQPFSRGLYTLKVYAGGKEIGTAQCKLR